jgi:hypothetical protein
MRRATNSRNRNGDSNDVVLIAACTLAFSPLSCPNSSAWIYSRATRAYAEDVRAALIGRLDWPGYASLDAVFLMVTLRTEADLLSYPVLGIARAATVLAIWERLWCDAPRNSSCRIGGGLALASCQSKDWWKFCHHRAEDAGMTTKVFGAILLLCSARFGDA